MKKIILTSFLMALTNNSFAEQETLKANDHFDGTLFHNNPSTTQKNFFDYLRWRFNSVSHPKLPTQVIKSYKPSTNQSENIAITFVGHSSFLLQARGVNILTDPIWSDRCSPVSFIGPKRRETPGIKFEDLPKIDAVLISHNHYDHMDLPTLKKLWDRDRPIFVVPLNNKKILSSEGIANVVELDWWQSIPFKNEIILYAVPAQHWSGRSLFDRNESLWAGFVLSFKDKNVFFAGDTGFGPHFQAIKERFGAFSLALLPIGAYLPLWFMAGNHLSPHDAIKAADIIKARLTIPMHFGTFALGDDGYFGARDELTELLKESPSNNFHIMAVGEHFQQQSSTTTMKK